MTIQNFMRSLRRSGYDAKVIYWYGFPVVKVEHDYSGPYPDENALNTSVEIRRRAEKHGFIAEDRGYKCATVVFSREYLENREKRQKENELFWQMEHDRRMKERS